MVLQLWTLLGKINQFVVVSERGKQIYLMKKKKTDFEAEQKIN